MPEWHFFAFNSKAVSKALLMPAQEAVRNHNLSAWQAIYDKLNTYHYPPHWSGFSWEGTILQNFGEQALKVSRDYVPDESYPPLRKCLQTFVELVSNHHLQSRGTRLRTWVTSIIRWKEILVSHEELSQMELFNKEAWAHQRHPPDPFWCLAANEAVDANYIDAQMVRTLAAEETRVGLFRRLAREHDIPKEVKGLVPDLSAAALLIQLAANLGLALYFREDCT